MDEYEVVALAKRALHLSLDEIKEMSFVTLANLLLSTVEEDDTRQASQVDIDKYFGG